MQVRRTSGPTGGNIYVDAETSQQLQSILEGDFIELDDLVDWSSKSEADRVSFEATWILTSIVKVQLFSDTVNWRKGLKP